MKSIVIFTLVLIPQILASLDHLSYTTRFKRDEFEGSGDSVDPTRVDEEPGDDLEGSGDDDSVGAITFPVLPNPAETTLPKETPISEPFPQDPNIDPVIQTIPTTEDIPNEVSTTPNPLPIGPQLVVTYSLESNIEVEKTTQIPKENIQTPSDVEVVSTTPNPKFVYPDLSIGDRNSRARLEGFDLSDEDLEDGGGGLDGSLNKKRKDKTKAGEFNDSESPSSSVGWSLIPVDDISLLIFILLCLILIVVLLICCFIIQNMTSWAIVKITPTKSKSNTYENVCPVKIDQDEVAVKYTNTSTEKEGTIELLSVSKLNQQHVFNVEKTIDLQPEQTQQVHRSTAEVIITGDPGPKYPMIIATIPRPTPGPKDTWVSDILKKIENEDTESISSLQFNEINELRKETNTPNGIKIQSGTEEMSSMTFLQKYAVNSNKKIVTTTTVESTASSNVVLNIEKSESERSKSLDELTVDDELDDYLENTSFAV